VTCCWIGCRDFITNIDRLATLDGMIGGYSLTQIKAYIDNLRAAGEQLRQNANPRLVLEVLMLDMPGKEEHRQVKPAAQLPV
jgi:hypothetical protein